MKKSLLCFLFASLTITAITGCKKQEKEKYQVKEETMMALASKKVFSYDGGEKIIYKTYDNQTLKVVDTKESYSYQDEIPSKPSNEKYHYDFAGWDITYDFKAKATIAKAKYESVLNEYEVRFADSNGVIINTQMVRYGEKPIVPEGFVANEKIKEVFSNKTYHQKARTVRSGDIYTQGLVFEVLDGKNEFAVINYYGEDEHVDIPSIYSGLPVTTIQADSFANAPFIKTIAIPNSIINIEPNAFRGIESLESFSLEADNPVYSLDGSGAIYWVEDFYGDPYNHLLYVPSGKVDLLEISEDYFFLDDGALTNTNATILKLSASGFLNFYYLLGEDFTNNNVKQIILTSGYIRHGVCEGMTNLYSVTICDMPQGADIDDYPNVISAAAFKDCVNLRGISLPSFVESIEDEAFMNCTSLEDVVLGFDDLSISSVGKDVFKGCESINGYLNQGVIFIGNKTHKYQIPVRITDELAENFVVPNDTLAIPDHFFEKNQVLTDVNFDQCERLKSIGEYAFYQCSKLDCFTERHYLPETLENVGYKAFTATKYDPNAANSSWFYLRGTSDKYCLVNLLKNCGEFELSPVCKFIDPYALRNGFATVKADANSTFESHKDKILLKDYYFVHAARSMTSISASDFLHSTYPYIACIDPYCFYDIGITNCGLIIQGSKSNQINHIGEYAFAYCKLDGNLTFNNYVTYVGDYAFYKGINNNVSLNITNRLTYAGECSFFAENRFTLKFEGSKIPETWNKNFDGKQGENTQNTYLFNQTM